ENHFGSQDLGRASRLFLPNGFNLLDCHLLLAPELRRLATFSEGQANDSDLPAALGIQRDCSSGPPHKICRMRAHHHRGFSLCHHLGLLAPGFQDRSSFPPLLVFSSTTYRNLIPERASFLARRIHRGRAVGMERFDRLEPPGLPLLAFSLTPSDRLPVRCEDQ